MNLLMYLGTKILTYSVLGALFKGGVLNGCRT